jgi:hypothetical protein
MATLYCECKHKLWSELWWSGSKHMWVFFDDERTSETYAEQITRCPECGMQLRYDGHASIGQELRASRNR